MRIALLTDGIYPYVIGGMQKHSFYLAKYFAIHKIEVDLYHTAKNSEEAHSLNCFTEEEKKYINSFVIPFPKLDKLPGHYIRESYAYSSAIYDELKRNKPVDFIYVQGFCGMKLLENKRELNIPVSVNFHGLEMFQKAANFKSKLEQYLFKRPVLRSLRSADIVFSLGGKLTDILIDVRIPKNKIIQIPIGIDESWIKKEEIKPYSKIKFLFIGRYERRKGIEELTKVLKALEGNTNFDFEFIGAIPKDKQLSASNIHYHGSISDVNKIKEIVSKADVLVCPSYSEGMPTVILEAMASGLAIIASDVGAVNEEVDSKNGILIEAGDINGLRKSIEEFIKMPQEKLLEMKQHSIQKIKKGFLWEDVILRTIEEINKE